MKSATKELRDKSGQRVIPVPRVPRNDDGECLSLCVWKNVLLLHSAESSFKR